MHLLSMETLTIALVLANFLSAKKYLLEVEEDQVDGTVVKDVTEGPGGDGGDGGYDYFYWRRVAIPMPRYIPRYICQINSKMSK